MYIQDHIAILNAYWEFNKRSGIEKMDFARENFLGIKTLKEMGDLKRQLLQVTSARCSVANDRRCASRVCLSQRCSESSFRTPQERSGVPCGAGFRLIYTFFTKNYLNHIQMYYM